MPQDRKEVIEPKILQCLSDIHKFEEDRDKICIEEYGGGPDESYLKGTSNALRLFAVDILRATCGIENESRILGCFDDSSETRIDFVKVVEAKDFELEKVNRIKTLLFQVIAWITILSVLFFLIVGFLVSLNWISNKIRYG